MMLVMGRDELLEFRILVLLELCLFGLLKKSDETLKRWESRNYIDFKKMT